MTSLDKRFFLGFIKVHILYHASIAPIYGAEMLAELAEHGYRLSPGTIYPTLGALHKQGYLRRSRRLVDGRVRKYYSATATGRAALAQARHRIRELVTEVIEEDPRGGDR